MFGVTVEGHFETMEQKLIYQAVVLPEIRAVIDKYSNLLEENGGK